MHHPRLSAYGARASLRLLLVAAFLVSACTDRPSAAGRPDDGGLEALRADAERRAEAWRQAVRALRAADLAEDAGPCDVSLPWPDPGPGPRSIDEALRHPDGLSDFPRRMRDLTFRLDRMGLVDRQALDGASPPLVYTTMSRIRSQPDDVRADGWWDHDLTLVVDARADARAVDGGFEGGHLQGTAVLFDYAEERIVCAAAVDGRNSDQIDVTTLVRQHRRFGMTVSEQQVDSDFGLRARLDLEHNAFLDAVRGLRRVAQTDG